MAVLLDQNIVGEQCAITTYKRFMDASEDKDMVTYNLALTILEQEVEHEEICKSLRENLDLIVERHQLDLDKLAGLVPGHSGKPAKRPTMTGAGFFIHPRVFLENGPALVVARCQVCRSALCGGARNPRRPTRRRMGPERRHSGGDLRLLAAGLRRFPSRPCRISRSPSGHECGGPPAVRRSICTRASTQASLALSDGTRVSRSPPAAAN